MYKLKEELTLGDMRSMALSGTEVPRLLSLWLSRLEGRLGYVCLWRRAPFSRIASNNVPPGFKTTGVAGGRYLEDRCRRKAPMESRHVGRMATTWNLGEGKSGQNQRKDLTQHARKLLRRPAGRLMLPASCTYSRPIRCRRVPGREIIRGAVSSLEAESPVEIRLVLRERVGSEWENP